MVFFGLDRIGILGAMLALGLIATPLAARAADITLLYDFQHGGDGNWPNGTLVADDSGNLLGTTVEGGSPECSGIAHGCGVIFKLAPSGVETLLYVFAGGADGLRPRAGLVANGDGNFYGTTSGGGSCPSGGCGTIFKLAPDGTKTIVHTFLGGDDGAIPSGRLATDKLGNLFGTTSEGGMTFNRGTVFKVSSDGTLTVIHALRGGPEGVNPQGLLLKHNKLYGATVSGGAGSCSSGCGTIFRISMSGTLETLYTFLGGSDGASPNGVLVADKAGNLYGTTAFGGGGSCSKGCGTVFRLAPDGTKTILHSFAGVLLDGATPLSEVVLDRAGNIYGTTYDGGGDGCTGGCGTVFKLSPDGSETILHNFNGAFGTKPAAGLILRRGYLYGTAEQGGAHQVGTIFKIKKE